MTPHWHMASHMLKVAGFQNTSPFEMIEAVAVLITLLIITLYIFRGNE